MTNKPIVLVTRKLPTAVESRLSRDFDSRLNMTDKIYNSDEIIELSAGATVIIPCHTEKFTADVSNLTNRATRPRPNRSAWC